VLTDPPYGINKGKIANDEDLSIWDEFVPLCYDVLRDDRFFLTFCSISKIPDVINIAVEHRFAYKWMSIFYINNGMVRGAVGFSSYHPVLIFEKGKAVTSTPLNDVFMTSAVVQEMHQREHPYQKNMKFIMRHLKSFSKPNAVVLDPFIGSGQTALACKALNRHFIGIEISEEYCDISRRRIDEFRPYFGQQNLLSFREE